MIPPATIPAAIQSLAPASIRPNPFSTAIYGDPDHEIGGLLEGIREHGISTLR